LQISITTTPILAGQENLMSMGTSTQAPVTTTPEWVTLTRDQITLIQE